ncbi:DUF6415 family natural product biosynthesis protein [Streptomyces boncukensis]|uniref:Uncharacterized protein n=1 Tax=Streptomyces boncukensis TaxID=2711219 RepID=A0A6G4WWI6_9ACTN|nr:DUF6415 family natural product biosynthesis protein [Streptomyces boncukensis]NGO69649.1 hypothetical protein [Streptomyces boncukensis]
MERRTPGQACDHDVPAFGEVAVEATDAATLRRFLEAMRRWQAEEQGDPVAVTPETVRRTVEYVLSRHFDSVNAADLWPTTDTLHAYLDALADAAEAELDTGRIVVAEMVARARAAASEGSQPSLPAARQTARMTRDLLSLLEREGWPGTGVRVP